jgi:hypothetical protein
VRTWACIFVGRWLRGLSVAGLALLAAPTLKADVTLTPSLVDRTILADALASTGVEFSAQTNGDGAEGLEPFAAAVDALAPTSGATADASAAQDSLLLGSSLRGDGQASAGVSIAEGATDALGSATGETVHQLVFDVDAQAPLVLSGLVEASPLPAFGDSFAIVEIIEADTLAILASFSVSDGQSLAFSEPLTLAPGVDYELFASALAIAEAGSVAPASETATARFSFALLPDGDGDGVSEDQDNCIEVANGPNGGTNDQSDVDADGFGDSCDCDFDNDRDCDISDFQTFLGDFTSQLDSGVGTDMTADGLVDITDFQSFLSGFQAGMPGPSGLVP